ncbi:Magnesium transporter protein isoform 2 [Schistosoma japonicum]|uniref:Magnesium transporter protein isoform 2 n=2 Tax=Schistosoma japonicum TaxID=6182 RepID=Q5DHP2_SCHJA|nr:SJCHGC02763 protein [Schistosoma japonicum]KAH8872395.1 Tumor suppressor candidate 3 [Schistosoma japonicum]KAH8872396.1 Tumor suppressor candidate 3 [Schistosoma japonicum]TNN15526.1 Magnesium transporter protein isoform 2 [Schistosoma japonicum]TNN15527.1 Magnesium transporter protein isoform 2 [Schistosoma japonicum]
MDVISTRMLFLFCLSVFTFVNGLSVEEILEKKVQTLNQLTINQPYIELDIDRFNLLLKSQPKNYSVILLLTALSPSRDCVPCKQAFEEFQIVATSWRYSKHRSDQLFFAVADFDNAPGVFEFLHLETAPAIVHVSPKGSIKQSDYMDIMISGFSSEAIVRWIFGTTQIQIRIFRPPSYTGTILLALFMSLGAAVLYFRRISLDCLYNRSLWSAISLGVILCAISGQVYNHIRGPPLFHAPPPNGEIKAFIYDGSDYQFVAETFIVMILYIGCSGGILLMTEVGSTTDPTKRKVCTISGIALFIISVNFILSIFRRKYHGYPYGLFFR